MAGITRVRIGGGLGWRIPSPALVGSPSTQRAGRQPGRLYWKYLAIIVSLVTISSTATAILQVRAWYDESQASLARLQGETALRAADTIQGFLGEVERQVSWSISPIQDSSPADLDRRREDYLRLLRQAPAVTDVGYLDRSGHEQLFVSRLAMNRTQSNIDDSQTTAFLVASPSRTYFSPVHLRRGSEPYLTIAIAEPGPRSGVTVAEVNLKLIWDIISPIKVGKLGSAYVTDSHGRLIAHRDLGLVLGDTNLSSLPQVSAAVSSQREPREGETSIVIGHDRQGREVVAAYRTIQPIGWTVFVEQPVEEAFAPIYASVWRTALVLVAGLVLAIVATLLLARRMVTPIRALSAGAASIGAGALDQRIQIRTGDELEVLANEFNRMAAQLQELYAGLEQRVDERTDELKGALDELKEKTIQLELASNHKTRFLANMSHELRTPLNSVIGFSGVLLQKIFGELNDRQEEYLKDVLVPAEYLLALVDDLLDLAMIEDDRMTLKRSEFWLPETLESTLGMLRETAIRRDLSLQLNVSPEVGIVTADMRRIRQIVLNLVSNSLKFTLPGGVVDLNARQDGSIIHISVRDTGVGIPLEDQERVFEPFERSDTARPYEGTGLGLTMVKRFVELHGGTVWLKSAPGEGTTVGFTIPQQVEDDDVEPQSDTESDDSQSDDPMAAVETSGSAASGR